MRRRRRGWRVPSERKIADELDPGQYLVHVTRTALLLEQQAESLAALRRETGTNANDLHQLRTEIAQLRTDLAVFKERYDGKLEGLATSGGVKGTIVTAIVALLTAVATVVWTLVTK